MELRHRQRPYQTSNPSPPTDPISPTGNTWKMFLTILLTVLVIPLTVLLISPSPIDAQFQEKLEFPALSGPLRVNDNLTNVKYLFKGKIHGPEAFVHANGAIYTGTADGKIVQIKNGELTTFATAGPANCETEETCGRPLGLRFDVRSHLLYVCDAYFGLYSVNVFTRQIQMLWPSTIPLEDGHPIKFLNDLDISSEHKIYMTDTSTKWRRKDFSQLALEGASTGRLIEYDIVANTTRILMTGLAFANGVQLTHDEAAVLVADTRRAHILKYHLKGAKAGSTEVFAKLPGFPDNLRMSPDGGYWIGMVTLEHRDKFSVVNYMSDKPWLRNILAKFGNTVLMSILAKYGLVVKLDSAGSIIQALHDPSGAFVTSVSTALETEDGLYLGSFDQDRISFLTKDHYAS